MLNNHQTTKLCFSHLYKRILERFFLLCIFSRKFVTSQIWMVKLQPVTNVESEHGIMLISNDWTVLERVNVMAFFCFIMTVKDQHCCNFPLGMVIFHYNSKVVSSYLLKGLVGICVNYENFPLYVFWLCLLQSYILCWNESFIWPLLQVQYLK